MIRYEPDCNIEARSLSAFGFSVLALEFTNKECELQFDLFLIFLFHVWRIPKVKPITNVQWWY